MSLWLSLWQVGGTEPAREHRLREPKVRIANLGQHQPLNRQCERFAREGLEVSLSTAADQVGAAACPRSCRGPRLCKVEVCAAQRLHGDDTTVPVLAKGKTVTGPQWTYVRKWRDQAGRGGHHCGCPQAPQRGQRDARKRRRRPRSPGNLITVAGKPRAFQNSFAKSNVHGQMGKPSSPAVSARPHIRFAFCTAWPAAPLPRLSTTPSAITRLRSGSAA